MKDFRSISKAKSNNFLNYFITVGAIFSVNLFFGTVSNNYLLIFLCFLIITAITRRVKLFDFRIAVFLLFVYLLILIQGLLFGGFSYAAIYTPLILFYVPYLIYQILKEKFLFYFVRVMLWIVIFTTPLWLLQSLVPDFDTLFRTLIEVVFPYSWAPVPRSLLIFTPMWADYGFNSTIGLFRNSGLFHEPGAYGVFLIFALIAQILSNRGNINNTGRVFIFASLTTLSTASYIALFVLLLSYYISNAQNAVKKLVIIVSFTAISFITYQSQEFLGEKITGQFQSQLTLAEMNSGIYVGQSGRFYAFITAYKLFLQNPLTGRGIIYATSEKASGEMHAEASYIYGPMGVMATYGILFAILYFFLIFKGLNQTILMNPNRTLVIGCFLSMLLAVSSQVFVLTFFMVYFVIIGLETHRGQIHYKPELKQNL